MKPDISIIMPGIRPQNWVRAYNSILSSTNRSFELIIVSPFPLPPELQPLSNVKYVKDFGNPTRASQIGALLIEGKYVFPTMADDAVFIPGAIDANLDELVKMGDSDKNVVVCKYSESQGFSEKERYQPDSYYRMVNAYPVSPLIVPPDWWIFNTVFIHRAFFERLGGYDASFETACMGHADLAIRAQKDGAVVKMTEFPILQCDHIPSGGDHTAIEEATGYADSPKFREKFSKPLDSLVINIPTDNWKNAQSIWSRRFTVNS